MELEIIQNKIHEIRGMRVMLDFDLAELYGVETKVLKRAVRRNIERFPPDFMFELSRTEANLLIDSLRCQIGTSNKGGTRYQPFAFTEQGVAMLSGVLSSPMAIQANINIMRAFVTLRHCALGYAELKEALDHFMKQTNTKFSEIYLVLTKLAPPLEAASKPRRQIGFLRPENE